MATYYVRPNGNDSNTGLANDDAHAWATMTKAGTACYGGDICYISGGATGSHTYTDQLRPMNSGSAGNYITFQAYPGDIVSISTTAGAPNWYFCDIGMPDATGDQDYIKFIGLRAIGSSTNSGVHLRGNYIELTDCYITDSHTCGIKVEQCDHLLIDNCEVYNVNYAGANECVSIMPATNFEVKNCHFHHGASGRIMFVIKDGCAHGSIHDNEIDHAITYEGLYVDGQGYAQDDINIYRNKIHHCDGYGVAINNEMSTGAQTNINIYNNLIYQNEAPGFFIYSTTAFHTTFHFVNNTLYDNYHGAGWAEMQISKSIPSEMTGSSIKNNIMVSISDGSYGFWYPDWGSDLGVYVDISYNCIYNAGGSWHAGAITGNNAITSDPLLVNPPTDLSISSGSPARDAGTATGAPSTDYLGVSRPQGVGYDIGAYEYTSGGGSTEKTSRRILVGG